MLDGRPEPEMVWWDAHDTDSFIRDTVAAGRTLVLIPWDKNAPQSVPPVGHWKRDGDLYVLIP